MKRWALWTRSQKFVQGRSRPDRKRRDFPFHLKGFVQIKTKDRKCPNFTFPCPPSATPNLKRKWTQEHPVSFLRPSAWVIFFFRHPLKVQFSGGFQKSPPWDTFLCAVGWWRAGRWETGKPAQCCWFPLLCLCNSGDSGVLMDSPAQKSWEHLCIGRTLWPIQKCHFKQGCKRLESNLFPAPQAWLVFLFHLVYVYLHVLLLFLDVSCQRKSSFFVDEFIILTSPLSPLLYHFL